MSLDFKLMSDAFTQLHRQLPRCVCCGTHHRDVKVYALADQPLCRACYDDEAHLDGEPCRHGQRPDEEE